jgi:regulator of sigma E protease
MFSSVAAFIIVLGILIFVHELGHFLMAKRFGVGVEKFSLGFGPKLIGKRYGETEYLLSAIPLGGYVKMVGEDPSEPLAPEDQHRAFNNQKVSRRFLIVVMGPISNILFAALIFVGMFMFGYPSDDTTIGWVEKNSPAWEAGLRGGDKILAVDGDPIKLWEQILQRIDLSETNPLVLEVKRDESILKVTVQPRLTEGKNLFGEDEKFPDIGIQHHSLAPVIGVSSPDSPAGRAGLKTGDFILAVNDQKVESFPELGRSVFHNLGEEILFEVQREEEKISLSVYLTANELLSIGDNSDRSFEKIGLFPADLFVRQVVSGSPAEEAGIEVDDRIVEIDGKAVHRFSDLQEIVEEKPGVALTLKLIRAGEVMTLTMTPEESTKKDDLGNKVPVGRIGIVSSFHPKPGPTILVRYNPFTALIKALALTWEFTVLIIVSLVKLFQQVIPVETIGGPILIAQLAGQQIQYGILELFKFMALISINLGILNLLPIPILDGGHILFFAIEGVRGRPLSMRKREIAQQFGLFLLLSLIIFVTYNDIMRMFG